MNTLKLDNQTRISTQYQLQDTNILVSSIKDGLVIGTLAPIQNQVTVYKRVDGLIRVVIQNNLNDFPDIPEDQIIFQSKKGDLS